MTITP